MFTALSFMLAFAPHGSGVASAVASVPDTTPLPAPAPVVQEEEIEDLGVWKGAVNGGVISTDGNTNLTSLSAGADAQLRREKDRITLSAYWNYQRQKPVGNQDPVSQRNAGANAQYDYFMNERTYLFGQASAQYDKQANLDLRYTVGGGVGHQFLEREDLKLSAEAGLAFFSEDFFTPPPGTPSADAEYLSARGAYDVDWQVNEDLQVLHSGVVFPSLEDSDDVYAMLDTRARVTLTESMFAQLQWVFNWDNTPAPGAGRRDNRYLLSVGWSF